MTSKNSAQIQYFENISEEELPSRFTNPFDYTPHPLVLRAANELSMYLLTRHDLLPELNKGKMLGVLVIRTPDNRIGFISAFSGHLLGSNHHTPFVPPVFDLLNPDDYFIPEEAAISRLNQRIQHIEQSEEYQILQKQVAEMGKMLDEEFEQTKQKFAEAKAYRDWLRQTTLTEAEKAALIKESQFQKAELKRLERRIKEEKLRCHQKLSPYQKEINQLKHERKHRSALLQERLFHSFILMNARGEQTDLSEIFRSTPQRVPPAGAGECALPKLLQFAYKNLFQPLASGEFWWGDSPRTEIRHHGKFYASCMGKCKPILEFMLQGLNVEKTATNQFTDEYPLEIIYEDDWLMIVDKPSGLLSVPGKESPTSVQSILEYKKSGDLFVVHRLDRDTSGLIVVAKDLETYKTLQKQFAERSIHKKYIALVEGTVENNRGTIDLPIAADYLNRPCQKVDYEKGKAAISVYEVAERRANQTLIHFYPLTGRTHQLRIHAAHPLGLGHPIVGDSLYGHPSDRLCLHATEIRLKHPILKQEMSFSSPISF